MLMCQRMLMSQRIMLLLCAAFALFAAVYQPTGEAFLQDTLCEENALCEPDALREPDVFRLHIIANSDSPADQAVKLAVRNAVLQAGRACGASGSHSAAEAEATLLKNGAALLHAAESTLCSRGFPYGAQLVVGEFPFPRREYAGKTYPAGRYRALRVVLGSGQGQNWWCVMFPPLCILELPDGEIDIEELELKSWLVEWIKGIDGGKLWKKLEEKLR